MTESVDVSRILKAWPYDADSDARFALGDDGRTILQVRTPVGIEQYELQGRPDGARPHGLETAFDYYLQRLEEARALGKETQFELEPDACTELFSEGTLFYFRYVRLFQLKDWGRTVRDTERNLRVFDFIHRYAGREQDQEFLEKWRPYILRVNGSAAAMLELEKRNYSGALRIAQQAVETIEALELMEDETFQFERERSLAAMRELAEQIRRNRPLSEMEQLEEQLRQAIERQQFENAARLRDRIRALRKQRIC